MKYARMSRRHALPLAIAAALSTTFQSPTALAQDDMLVLEEILVTARKRIESLQDISQSVSAMSESEIDASFARDIRDLEGMAPNLVIDRIGAGPGVSSISIRGVTHQDVEKSFDPAVGVVLDGIFLGTNTGQELQIFDMERIEVLRGPQGTLFGRNSIGGIINVTRTDPTMDWGAKVRATAGNYDRVDLEGVFNFPIIEDQLGGKINYVLREQDEGYIENIEKDDDLPQTDYESYGVNFLWQATDTLTLEYIYQYEEDNSDTGETQNVSQPGDLLCFGLGRCAQSASEPEIDRFSSDINFSNNQFIELDAHTFEVNWDISDSYTLTYLSGSRESDEGTDQDFDSTNLDFFSTRRLQEYEQESHELRLAGSVTDSLQFTAGLYYWDAEYELDQTTFFLAQFVAPGSIPTTNLTANARQETTAEAFFAEVDWAITEKLALTLGGRYTSEEKELALRNDVDALGDGSIIAPIFNTFDDPADDEWSEFTPKISLKWYTTDDMMLYATYSEGFRSGGLNGRAATEDGARRSYDPEFVKMFEIGLKSSWFDNRIQFNAAIFDQSYEDKQEEVVVPAPPPAGQQTLTLNASEATMQGIELELRALVAEGWMVSLNAGYLDAEYDDFLNDQDLDGTPEDLSFLELRRAPKYTWALNSTYDWDIGGGTATVQAIYRYKDEMATTFLNEPFGIADAHGILDASIAYQYGAWNFRVFGRNLTDEDDITNSALAVGGLFAFQAQRAPLTWGAQIAYEFQ
ncbi:MAG: TonB-dependent receptor [Pseudomonadota bacterium]